MSERMDLPSDTSRFRNRRPLESLIQAARFDIKTPDYHDPHGTVPLPAPYDSFRQSDGPIAYESLTGPTYQPSEYSYAPDPVPEPFAPHEPLVPAPAGGAALGFERAYAAMTQDFFIELMDQAAAMADPWQPIDGAAGGHPEAGGEHGINAEPSPVPTMGPHPGYDATMMDQEFFDQQMQRIDPFDMPGPPMG